MQLSRHCLIAVSLLVAAAAQAQTTHDVDLSGFSFLPADITIDTGDTVHWIWVSGQHNVESGEIAGGFGVPDGNFISGAPTLVVGTTYDVIFDQAFLDANPMPGDVYPYYCVIHAGVNMAGTITVVDPIPTVSEWGLAALGLVLLIAGSVLVVRRGKTAVPARQAN